MNVNHVCKLWKPKLEKSAPFALPLKSEPGEDTSARRKAAIHLWIFVVKKLYKVNDFAESGAMYILPHPFVEITFYNMCKRSFLDVMKVLYSDQIYGTV